MSNLKKSDVIGKSPNEVLMNILDRNFFPKLSEETEAQIGAAYMKAVDLRMLDEYFSKIGFTDDDIKKLTLSEKDIQVCVNVVNSFIGKSKDYILQNIITIKVENDFLSSISGFGIAMNYHVLHTTMDMIYGYNNDSKTRYYFVFMREAENANEKNVYIRVEVDVTNITECEIITGSSEQYKDLRILTSKTLYIILSLIKLQAELTDEEYKDELCKIISMCIFRFVHNPSAKDFVSTMEHTYMKAIKAAMYNKVEKNSNGYFMKYDNVKHTTQLPFIFMDKSRLDRYITSCNNVAGICTDGNCIVISIADNSSDALDELQNLIKEEN